MERLKRNFILALALGDTVYLVLAIVSGFGSLTAALEAFDFALSPVILGLVLLSYAGRFLRWFHGADRCEEGSGNARTTDFTASEGYTKDNTVETL